MQELKPINTISLISMYCCIYEIPITDIGIPSSVLNKLPESQLESVFHEVQIQWLENATGRSWSSEEFFDLALQISDWIDELPQELCESRADFERFWATSWKRGAQRLLRLNIKS